MGNTEGNTTTATIRDAEERVIRLGRDMRTYGTRKSQLRYAVDDLLTILGPSSKTNRALTVKHVTKAHVQLCVDKWRDDGLSAGTTNIRLGLFRLMGIDISGCRRRRPSTVKWHLTPEDEEPLLEHLRSTPEPFGNAHLLADYIEFVTHTGVRVEEAIRLRWSHVHLKIAVVDGKVVNKSLFTVPGTKTAGSTARLALALIPALLLQRRKAAASGEFVFPIPYRELDAAWQHARAHLGVAEDPLATLKALRRTAARHLTGNGMPAPVLMQYLRHSNIQTTMGYLRVTGYSAEEQRKWLE